MFFFSFLFIVKLLAGASRPKRPPSAPCDRAAGVGGHVTRCPAWPPDRSRPTKHKERQNLPLGTMEKMSEGWKYFGFLSFLGGSFPRYCWFFVAYLCVAFFCYKRRLKMRKRDRCWVKSVQWEGWGDTLTRTAFLQYGTFCFDFCKPPPVFTCMSLSKKREDQQNETFTVSFPCPVR